MDIKPPILLSNFIINKNNAKILSTFNTNNLTNILLYGQPNTGKKTLVHALIKHLYNVNTYTIHTKEEVFTYNRKNYSCIYTYTNFYYNIDFAKNIKCSKYIINSFIKNICNNTSINNTFRIIIIHNLDLLDIKLIKSFIHIIEKYYTDTRFIIVSNTNEPKLFKSLLSFSFTLKCHIDKDDITSYINHHKCKLSKKITAFIYSCNNLYLINKSIEFKTLPVYAPILKYVKKIYNIIKNNNHILFIEKIRTIIYEMYLLNFNLYTLILKSIQYIIDTNKHVSDKDIHTLYHYAALYDPSHNNTIQPFTLIETFYIQVKILDVCK